MIDEEIKIETPDSGSLTGPLLAEYAALRAEILSRIQFRQQLTGLTLAATAALLGAGMTLENPTIALVLPVLIPFLALSWVHNDLRVGAIAEYIRTHIEVLLPDMQWETRMQETRVAGPDRRRWRTTVVCQAAVFAVIQAFAVLIGTSGSDELAPDYVLFWVGGALIVAMLAVMSRAILRYRTT